MAKRLFPAIAVLAVTFGCESPTAPAASLTGQWTGTFSVTDCVRTGGFPNSTCWSTEMPGASLPAAVLFMDPDSASIEGYGDYGPYAEDIFLIHPRRREHLQRFRGQLQPDGSLRFGGGSGAGLPTTVTVLSWSLKLVSADRLEGTLEARHSFYKEPGVHQLTGTVVLQRQAPRALTLSP